MKSVGRPCDDVEVEVVYFFAKIWAGRAYSGDAYKKGVYTSTFSLKIYKMKLPINC